MDSATVAAANITYRQTLMLDERRPNDPSRSHGLLPNCQRCQELTPPHRPSAGLFYQVTLHSLCSISSEAQL